MKDAASVIADANLLAHILPGTLLILVILWLRYANVTTVLAKIKSASTSVGESLTFILLFLLAAAAIGLIVDGLRSVFADGFIHKWRNLTFPAANYYRLYRAGQQEVVREIHQDFFRYYQFYLNTSLVAVTAAVGSIVRAFWRRGRTTNVVVAACSMGVAYGLARAAGKALRAFYEIVSIVGRG